MRKTTVKLAVVTAALMLAAAACAAAQPAPATAPSAPAPVVQAPIQTAENTSATFNTERLLIPVSVSAAQKADNTVAAWLTRPVNGRDIIFITVPGSTYGHTYWDFPYKPEIYSFVRTAAGEGYSILNIDRLGSGESSRPGSDVTGDVQAWVVYQLVNGLRSGKIGGHPYSKVILAGHSLGSCVIIQEASTYANVDGLIVTGLLHNESFPKPGVASLTPAMQVSLTSSDPIFKGVPYISYTTLPGRRDIFYNMETADPEVLKTDEQTKVITPYAENSVFKAVKLTDKLKAPVFIAVGEVDRIFCEAPSRLTLDKVNSEEVKYFQPTLEMGFYVLPGAGHDINLHSNAPQWYKAALDWVTAKIK